MYFVINMDIDTGIDGLGHIHHGRILDDAQFSALLNHTDMIESVSFSSWDRAADYVETVYPEFSTGEVTDAMADITTGELLTELVIRIECTNGLDFISQENLKGLISRLIDHLDDAP